MSTRKSISNTFTVTTLVDGESAPYYFEEKYAWSNDSSTKSVTTPPSISGGWQTSIPPSNGYAYLWRMSIRHVWNESTRSYTQEAAQYFRMSGTNGTSIHIKGHVPTVQNLPTTHLDGDAYVVDANGHLYMWSDESGSWVDIGVFQGEAGKTYYTHIAWASKVNYSGTTVTSVNGFIIDKSPNDTTHMWMGVYIDEQSGQDESNALRYTWSYTKGVDGISVQARYAPNDNPTASQIHTTWQDGDLYMQTKQSNETDWSSWHKIVGESGSETDYSFNISKEKTSASATTAPSNCYYGTWRDAPIPPTSTYPYLWMQVQKKDGNGNNVGDASYARVTGELGIDYEIRCAIDSIKIPKDTTSTSVTTTFNFYYKESGKLPIAYNAYYGIYYRIGTAYTLISSGSSRGASLSAYSIDNTKAAIVVFIFSASYSGNNPMSQSYLSKLELPIYKDGKDGLTPNLNILLRTVFDRDIDKVKEKWSGDWNYINIDVASDTVIDGRKSIRINASSASTHKDFYQDIYGKIKTGTWYTLSFCYFATSDFLTFIYDGANTYGIVDRTAGYYIDGVYNSGDLDIDGNHQWGSEWQGKRHSITFKTKSSFGTTSAMIAFRCPQGAQLAICMPKLEIGKDVTPYVANEDDLVGDKGDKGDKGDTGGRGKTGRFYYYAQEWSDDSSVSYAVTDAEAPYFLYNNNYWVFNPANNGTYTMSEMGAPSSSNNNWKLMVTDFKFIITEAIFGSYAHFGSAIINGDWLISTHGKRNGEDSAEYTYFDASDPSGISSSSHFAPNYCVDLNTGATYMNNAFIKGELSGVTGSFKSLNCVNNSGTVIARISFDPGGRLMFESGDLYNQGMKDGRALRFYSGDIWCRGAFGARTRTVLLVNGSHGYYYSKGTGNAGQLVSFASATSSRGQTYYTIECYGQNDDYSGYPVDEIVFNIETGTYRYQLNMAGTQRVLLINANDYNSDVFVYVNGNQEQWYGGSVGEIIKLPISFMNPQPANTVLGRGLVVGATRDNNWG